MFSKVKTGVKNWLLRANVHNAFGFLTRPSLLISNTLKLSAWIAANVNESNKGNVNFNNREAHYAFVNDENIKDQNICYLEFGVFKGDSIKWWLSHNANPGSRFYGFDTFEGLPEKWGTYTKGDFFSNMPQVDDERAQFIKGLFQDTLQSFLKKDPPGGRILLHLDADLFSSTMYVLTTLAPYLKSGDIILFDEFSVPNDEFSAFEIFCRSFYINYRLLSATRNFFQTGIEIV